MRSGRLSGILFSAALLAACSTNTPERTAPPAAPPVVNAQADALLKKMSDTLAAAQSFTFRVHAITEQVLESGQKIEVARNSSVSVRRPDRLNVVMAGDVEEFRYVYDGKQVTLHNLKDRVYGQLDMPPTIDAALETLAKQHGMVIPLEDLVESNPYAALRPLIISGEDLGTGYVFETKCRHLAFRQQAVDWQIWLEEGSAPLPRKVVITYKLRPGMPEYVAYLSNWQLSDQVPETTFTFAPPPGDRKVDAVAPAAKPPGSR